MILILCHRRRSLIFDPPSAGDARPQRNLRRKIGRGSQNSRTNSTQRRAALFFSAASISSIAPRSKPTHNVSIISSSNKHEITNSCTRSSTDDLDMSRVRRPISQFAQKYRLNKNNPFHTIEETTTPHQTIGSDRY